VARGRQVAAERQVARGRQAAAEHQVTAEHQASRSRQAKQMTIMRHIGQMRRMGPMSYRPIPHSSHASHLSPTSHSPRATSSLLPPTSSLQKSGSALIIAIWTIALLSILVLSFAFDAMLEGRIGTFVRHRQRVNYLTQSGVAIAEHLLEKQRNVSATSTTTAEEDRWKAPALRIKRGQTSIIDEPLGDGIIHVEIIPEQSRWNINKLCKSAQSAAGGNANATQPLGQSDLVWEQILRTAGVPDERMEDLIDCWDDWVDADSTITGRNGAEDEYYKQETDPLTREPRIPYKTRNGPIDTIDELRLVKGFIPAILDGGILNPEERRPDQQIVVRGIKELFTTYGDGKINVNAAPREVLMTIPDMDDITAGAIIEEREGRGIGGLSGASSSRRTTTPATGSRTATGVPEEEEDFSFKSVGDFMSRVPGIPPSIQQYVTVNSSVFRLNIEGRSAGISHRIEAIAELNGDKVRYLRWREDP
jgi:Type II secretion system (T2SS), protein K